MGNKEKTHERKGLTFGQAPKTEEGVCLGKSRGKK